jgi:phosphopentomutase
VGKIYDIFAHRGMSEHYFTTGNTQGIAKTLEKLGLTLEISKRDFDGLCYTNLVDCDMLYGHRRDIDGYARAISEFDECLPELCANLNDDDFLMITADHGCDPGYKGTDHTREYVPLIIYSKSLKNINLKTIDGFGVVCNTALSLFGINEQLEGENVIDLIK